jgi:hypothetical protein
MPHFSKLRNVRSSSRIDSSIEAVKRLSPFRSSPVEGYEKLAKDEHPFLPAQPTPLCTSRIYKKKGKAPGVVTETPICKTCGLDCHWGPHLNHPAYSHERPTPKKLKKKEPLPPDFIDSKVIIPKDIGKKGKDLLRSAGRGIKRGWNALPSIPHDFAIPHTLEMSRMTQRFSP